MGNWGPVEKPVEHGVKPIAAHAEGDVTEPTEPGGGKSAPHYSVDYNATDGRHNRESGMEGWESVDKNSGCDAEDGFVARSRFPDGPGVWRQT